MHVIQRNTKNRTPQNTFKCKITEYVINYFMILKLLSHLMGKRVWAKLVFPIRASVKNLLFSKVTGYV